MTGVPSVTLDDARNARIGAITHYAPACSPTRVERWRVNGKCKLWKTRPGEFRLPIKFGLYGHSYITELNAHDFHLASNCPYEQWRE